MICYMLISFDTFRKNATHENIKGHNEQDFILSFFKAFSLGKPKSGTN